MQKCLDRKISVVYTFIGGNNMKKIIDVAHSFLDNYCNKETIFVDFTLGNGHDSAYFFTKVKKSYAFDIQQIAIDTSLKNYPFLQQSTLILDSHANCLNYLTYFDVGIFNLGYLPTQDKNITTLPSSTLTAIKNALQILSPTGILCVVVYIGHSKGKAESDALLTYIETLPKQITVSKYTLLNKNTAPYILFFQKNK